MARTLERLRGVARPIISGAPEKGDVRAVVEAPQVKIAERARKAMLELAALLKFDE